jgi:hypothetical protein
MMHAIVQLASFVAGFLWFRFVWPGGESSDLIPLGMPYLLWFPPLAVYAAWVVPRSAASLGSRAALIFAALAGNFLILFGYGMTIKMIDEGPSTEFAFVRDPLPPHGTGWVGAGYVFALFILYWVLAAAARAISNKRGIGG